jgi:LAS superfamily LD-carboxypeptidase LdcB
MNYKRIEHILAPLALALAAAGAVGGFLLYSEVETLKARNEEMASTTAQALALLEQKNLETADLIYALQQSVAAIQARLGGFESTVDTLEKLSKTDPELLQKYSKVFFLNEHYTPPRLSEIEKEYLYSEDSPEQIHASVRPYLERLLNAVQDDGIELYVKSAYRSFDEQSALKGSYSVTYGIGSANQFSADQGYSEHQLGTTVDFVSVGQGGQLAGFDKTEAYAWLLENAHTYGFTLSYPPNNAYYVYEPWHWRFVGVELATYLHNRGKYFYDLEQRQIDEYLVELFD